MMFANAADYAPGSSGDATRWPYLRAPRLEQGDEALVTLRAMLLERAALAHRPDVDPDLHLVVDEGRDPVGYCLSEWGLDGAAN
jgi:hypothetical protein